MVAPGPFCADHTARYSNMPQRLVIATSTIIPLSNAIVLKSMPRMASSWLSTPETIMTPAPSIAMLERLIRSATTSA